MGVWGLLEASHDLEEAKPLLEEKDLDDADLHNRELKTYKQMLEIFETSLPGEPLIYACKYGSLEVVKELREKGQSVSSTEWFMGAPLHTSTYVGSLEIVRYLVDQGADTNHEAGLLKRSPIFYSFVRHSWKSIEESIETFMFLLNYETNIRTASTPGFILLHSTVACPDTRPLRAVIAKGSDVNERIEETGRTALAAAAGNGQIDHISILLEAGADTKVEDKNGHTPLFCALFSEKSDCVEILLEHNADVNHRDHDQWTALHFAARFDLVEIAEILLDSGAELKVLTNKSVSPLMVAAGYGSSNMANFLCHHDAQIGHYNIFGRTAFDLAVLSTSSFSPFFWRTCTLLPESSDGVSIDDLVEAMVQKNLVEFGTLLDSIASKPENLTHSSLLHIAVICGSLEIVKKLLNWGIDPNFSLPNGRTALHVAATLDSVGITECLIKHGSTTTCMDIKDYTPWTKR